MTDTINEAAERALFQVDWCPPDHDEAPGFEVHKQLAWEAWMARARLAAEREAGLRRDVAELAKYRGGIHTHGPKCWSWGWRHYACAEAEIARLNAALTTAVNRLDDMLKGDDGQAWKEAERVLPTLNAAIAQEPIRDR